MIRNPFFKDDFITNRKVEERIFVSICSVVKRRLFKNITFFKTFLIFDTLSPNSKRNYRFE